MSKNKNNSEIKKAVRDIPGMIYDEVHKKNTTTKTPIYVSPHNSKTWLTVGVIIFSLCIIALWGVNIASIFYETQNSNDPTVDIIQNSRSELQKVMNTFSEKEKTLNDINTSTQDIISTTPTTTTQTIDATNTIQDALSTLFQKTTSTLTTTSTHE